MIWALTIERRSSRGKSAAAFSKKARGPLRLELHQPNESVVVDARRQIAFGIVEPRQVLLRQVNAPMGQIFVHVAQDVGHLQGQPELDRIFAQAGFR